MGCYTIHVVGESYRNTDGRSRQAILRNTSPGEAVQLVREPHNKHDPDAIAVHVRGGQVGYVGSDYLGWLTPLLDAGKEVQARVHGIRGGSGDRPSFGAVIQIVTAGGEFDQLEARERGGLSFTSRVLLALVAILIIGWLASCAPAQSEHTYTLYRNSALDGSLRVHWATFDADDNITYNMNNCLMAARLLNANMTAAAGAEGMERDSSVGFWCEPGPYRDSGLVPSKFAEAFPTDV